MANNFKRMQKLAGLITESEYRESQMNEAEKMDEAMSKEDIMDKISKLEDFEDTEDNFKYGNYFVQKYDNDYVVWKNRGAATDSDPNPDFESSNIAKVVDFLMKNKQIKENRIGALLNTVADDWGEDSDFYSDLEDSLTGWVDRNGQLTPKGKISIKNLLSNWDLLDDYGHFLDDDMNENESEFPYFEEWKKSIINHLQGNNHYSIDTNMFSKMTDPYDAIDYLVEKEFLYDNDLDRSTNINYIKTGEYTEDINEGDTDYDRAKDAKRLGKKGEKNIYGAGVKKGEEIEKKKMKMSELKAAIKELALSEGEDDVNFNDDESLYDPVYEGVWSVLPARIPEFIQKIKDIKDEYHAVVGSDDVYDGLDHAISAAEELMNSKLSEAKKDEEVEDIKDVDVTVGDEETTADVTTVDVDPNVKAVQDALTQAQAAAEKLGDEKLTDQIGNTITFFTRTHVVEKPGMTAESNIKERINKLVKSLNETAVDEEKDTDTLTQNDIKALYNNGFNIIAQPDWNFVRIQKDFKSPKADWRFLNNLLSSKNIPSDIDYWRGDGDKGRNKRLEISKKYFDKNIKYPAFK
jgi:hypothetical protein